MRSRVLLVILALSFAANAALGYLLFFRWRGDTHPSAADRPTAAETRAPRSAAPIAVHQLGQTISTAQTVGDFRDLAAQLRAAGWSDDVVTMFVRSLVSQEFSRRHRQIFDWASVPFWRDTPLTPEQQDRWRALDREQRDFLLALNLPRTEQERAKWRRDYGNLSDAKLNALEKIFRDYGDLRQELQANQRTSGARAEKDSEAQSRLLSAEMQSDIEALLTPEEKAEYDFRRSGDFAALKMQLGNVEVTEQEFRALDAAQKAFRATQPGSSLEPENANQLAAWDGWQRQVRATLGDERYRAFVAAQLAPAAPRFFAEHPGVTAAQIQALARLQRTAPFELQKEMLAPNLTGEERQARVTAVNQRFRAQLVDILGPQYAAEALAKNVLRYTPGGG